jgi:hypothetical protein
MAEPMEDAMDHSDVPGLKKADGKRYRFPDPFRVTSVERVHTPEGAQGLDWCRYVLQSGASTIVGQRRGSLEDVKAYATQSAEQMNARRLGTRSAWSPRGKKPG